MKSKLILLVALLLLSLSGCGIVSVGYNYADVYLRYTINSYATFSDVQKQAIRKEVDGFMQWHRREMLPAYVAFLKELRQVAQSGAVLKQEDVARFRVEIRALYVKTLQPTIRPAAIILRGIETGQIDELSQSFEKENSKQKDKELSGNQDEQLRKRAERTIDFIENIVGGLSDMQLEKIREMSHGLPYATGLYIRLREENQARLLELLKEKKNENEIAEFLAIWLASPESIRSQEEQRILQNFEVASEEMIVKIYELLTERQKKSLLKYMEKYINIFQELANASQSEQ